MKNELDNDHVLLILIGCFAAPWILAAAAAKLPNFRHLLLDWNVLAPATEQLVFTLTPGAGLDLNRVIALAAVLVILIVWAAWLIRRRISTTDTENRARR